MGKDRSLTDDEAGRVAEVFETHRGFIESVAGRHARHSQHVPEIVQTVGVRLCQGLSGFRRESAIRTWLFRVTVNTARDFHKRERRHVDGRAALPDATEETDELQLHVDPDQDEQIHQAERLEALQDAIDRMRPNYAAVIRNQLEEPAVLESSKTTRHRARQQLKELLADDPRLAR